MGSRQSAQCGSGLRHDGHEVRREREPPPLLPLPEDDTIDAEVPLDDASLSPVDDEPVQSGVMRVMIDGRRNLVRYHEEIGNCPKSHIAKNRRNAPERPRPPRRLAAIAASPPAPAARAAPSPRPPRIAGPPPPAKQPMRQI